MTDQKKNHLLDILQKVKEMEEREVWLREELIMVSSTKRGLLVQMEAALQASPAPIKPTLREDLDATLQEAGVLQEARS